MEHDGEEESGEMFSPNESGEYMPHEDVMWFTVQGLRDLLTAAESTVTELLCPVDEYIIQLEVTMVDWPGQLHPPAFSWNAGMVLHVLKSDPALRELEHVQVDGPGIEYLFYDRHGRHGLMKEAALAICSHLVDVFVEWIGRSAHFEAVPLLLDEGCHHATSVQDRHRQCIQTQEQPNLLVHAAGAASSGSSLQLVGGALSIPEGQDGGAEQEMPRANVGRLRRCPMKARPMPGGGGGGSPPSSLEHPGRADSDDYSTASESGGG